MSRHAALPRDNATPSRTTAYLPSESAHAGGWAVALSAVVLTKNSAARLDEVLRALHWCDDIVVFDTGSSDDTLRIARRFLNVQVHELHGTFPGFGRARRQAVACAKHDWILSVDSDEIVTPALAQEIAALGLDPRTVYAMPFENYFNGRRITTCGWHPDWHERLFHRGLTNFSEMAVHEHVQTRATTVRMLRHAIRHYPYENVDDFLRKMRNYGALFAAQHAGRKRSSPGKAVLRSGWAFFKSYLLQRGFMQGGDGLLISASKAQGVFWKYFLLYEANQRRT